MGQALVSEFIDRPAPPPKHTILDNIVGNKMRCCSLFFVFPLSLRFFSLKPTPSLLINIGKHGENRCVLSEDVEITGKNGCR